jgi:hypothetical protein
MTSKDDNISEYNKWKNLSDILYKCNNNQEEIIIIYNMIIELYSFGNNDFSEINIYKNYHKIESIIDLFYNIFGDGICNNRKEYEFYRSFIENNLENKLENGLDEITQIGLYKFKKFRKYLELLNFVKNKYNQNIDLISKNLPKWFVAYLGFNYLHNNNTIIQ